MESVAQFITLFSFHPSAINITASIDLMRTYTARVRPGLNNTAHSVLMDGGRPDTVKSARGTSFKSYINERFWKAPSYMFRQTKAH